MTPPPGPHVSILTARPLAPRSSVIASRSPQPASSILAATVRGRPGAPGPAGSTGRYVSEILTPAPDGVRTMFQASRDIPQGERLFVNGLKQTAPADYTIDGNNVTFTVAPLRSWWVLELEYPEEVI